MRLLQEVSPEKFSRTTKLINNLFDIKIFCSLSSSFFRSLNNFHVLFSKPSSVGNLVKTFSSSRDFHFFRPKRHNFSVSSGYAKLKCTGSSSGTYGLIRMKVLCGTFNTIWNMFRGLSLSSGRGQEKQYWKSRFCCMISRLWKLFYRVFIKKRIPLKMKISTSLFH